MKIFLSLMLMIWSFGAAAQTNFTQQAETYLNSLTTAKARFTQTAEWDGSQLSGTFYLNRPGKLRFDYDAPLEDFIVADGTFIFYYDAALGEQTNAPIGSTLADFILRDPIRLSGDVTVTSSSQTDTTQSLTLVQTQDPHVGNLTLTFYKEPFRLESWTVTDAQGLRTKVSLSDITTGISLPSSMFYYIDPDHGQMKLNE